MARVVDGNYFFRLCQLLIWRSLALDSDVLGSGL